MGGRVIKKLLVVAMAAGLFAAMPAFAADHADMKMDTKEGVRECALKAESIQEKIKRLETEVAKGEKKYNAKELKKLEKKLKEANEILDQLNRN